MLCTCNLKYVRSYYYKLRILRFRLKYPERYVMLPCITKFCSLYALRLLTPTALWVVTSVTYYEYMLWIAQYNPICTMHFSCLYNTYYIKLRQGCIRWYSIIYLVIMYMYIKYWYTHLCNTYYKCCVVNYYSTLRTDTYYKHNDPGVHT